MSITWTSEQIAAMAPDVASAKAGQGLASARNWETLGQDDEVAWGECKGSGKNPYQTQVSLAEPSFKCSCPSRKFPCKHGLGLLLLRASQPNALTQTEPPAWVQEWLQGRAKRTQAQTERAARKEAEPIDVAAQAKRAEKREGRVTAGVAELELWLRDAMRRGLADLPREYAFWDASASRMTDAQAPGLARLLRETGSLAASSNAHEPVLARLASVHLLLEGWKRLDSLPIETQSDVRATIGFTPDAAELSREPKVRDAWIVTGSRVTEEDRLRACRTWLWGQNTGRPALVLQFAHGNAPFDLASCGGSALIPGTVFDAELTFFPGAAPLRAVVRERLSAPQPATELPTLSISEALESYARALAGNPWLEAWPLALRDVVLVRVGERWAARDETGELPISADYFNGWRVLAASGGRSFLLCGEWNGAALTAFAARADNWLSVF